MSNKSIFFPSVTRRLRGLQYGGAFSDPGSADVTVTCNYIHLRVHPSAGKYIISLIPRHYICFCRVVRTTPGKNTCDYPLCVMAMAAPAPAPPNGSNNIIMMCMFGMQVPATISASDPENRRKPILHKRAHIIYGVTLALPYILTHTRILA